MEMTDELGGGGGVGGGCQTAVEEAEEGCWEEGGWGSRGESPGPNSCPSLLTFKD